MTPYTRFGFSHGRGLTLRQDLVQVLDSEDNGTDRSMNKSIRRDRGRWEVHKSTDLWLRDL